MMAGVEEEAALRMARARRGVRERVGEEAGCERDPQGPAGEDPKKEGILKGEDQGFPARPSEAFQEGTMM